MSIETRRDLNGLLLGGKRRLGAALAMTVLLGIASRKLRIGYYLVDKSLGDVLYGVAAYLTVAIAQNGSTSRTAALACAGCWSVEFFKLTGIPASYSHVPLVPWVLGRGFSWHNMLCYPIGVLVGVMVDLNGLRTAASGDFDSDRETTQNV